jgi:hypothetical protein
MRDIPDKVLERLRSYGAGLSGRLRLALFNIAPSFKSVRPPAPEPLLADTLARTEIGRLFAAHRGRVIDKWLWYFEAYERHFAPLRGRPIRLLEIGVFKGGSLELWRQYFGPDAVIFGVDIDPECAARVDAPNQVRIGSQADGAFLARVVSEMGGVDVVIDDGSHVAAHQRASFAALFPLLEEGGLYVIEDMHTSYWPGFHHGGNDRPGTAVEFAKQLIDDLHRSWHWRRRRPHGPVGAVHAYDSMVFIEKRQALPPYRVSAPL